MAKRAAEKDLNQHNWQEDDSEASPSEGEFVQASAEKIQSRQIRSLPKRKGLSSTTAASPSPQTAQPTTAAKIPFANAFQTISTATKSQEPNQDASLNYYRNVRGLNQAVLNVLSKVLEQDPFADLVKLLQEVTTLYSSTWTVIDGDRPASVTAPASSTGSPSALAALSKPAHMPSQSFATKSSAETMATNGSASTSSKPNNTTKSSAPTETTTTTKTSAPSTRANPFAAVSLVAQPTVTTSSAPAFTFGQPSQQSNATSTTNSTSSGTTPAFSFGGSSTSNPFAFSNPASMTANITPIVPVTPSKDTNQDNQSLLAAKNTVPTTPVHPSPLRQASHFDSPPTVSPPKSNLFGTMASPSPLSTEIKSDGLKNAQPSSVPAFNFVAPTPPTSSAPDSTLPAMPTAPSSFTFGGKPLSKSTSSASDASTASNGGPEPPIGGFTFGAAPAQTTSKSDVTAPAKSDTLEQSQTQLSKTTGLSSGTTINVFGANETSKSINESTTAAKTSAIAAPSVFTGFGSAETTAPTASGSAQKTFGSAFSFGAPPPSTDATVAPKAPFTFGAFGSSSTTSSNPTFSFGTSMASTTPSAFGSAASGLNASASPFAPKPSQTGDTAVSDESKANDVAAPVVNDTESSNALTSMGEGEEDEDAIGEAVKARVYMHVDGNWEDKGIALCRVKRHRTTGKTRLLARHQSHGRAVLNFNLYDGLVKSLKVVNKTVRFLAMDDATPRPVQVRVKTAEQAAALSDLLRENTPED